MRLTVTLEERTFDWFASRLDLAGARRIGDRDILCRCPAHDDYSPSLHVWEDERGFQVHCFAGCTRAEVEEALQGSLPVSKPIGSLPLIERGPVVAAYDYRNADGELVFRKYRHEPKDFSIRRPVAVAACKDGPVTWSERIAWHAGLKDPSTGEYLIEPVPYKLPELLRHSRAWVVDGEKDADRLAGEGVFATCSPFGMARWLPEWNEYLRGRRVVIVADRDEPGSRAAVKLAQSLDEIARSVKVVEARSGKDAFDHLEAGYDVDEFGVIA